MYVHTYIHTYIRTYIHTYMQTYVHTYVHHRTHKHAIHHKLLAVAVLDTSTICTKHRFSVICECMHIFNLNYLFLQIVLNLAKEGMLDRHTWGEHCITCIHSHACMWIHGGGVSFEASDVNLMLL